MADNQTATPLADIENRICPGCKKSAVNESGGLVVAFGQSFFHVDCFKCAKCNNQVTADTNLLLLSDGSPICADCSYNCNICQQPILDEAIMTGDDSYHAHCFKCKVCHNRIDELVFAKTSHGIYCMNCHNERMAKIRRHAQRKREREKAAASSSRDVDAPNFSPPSSLRSKASTRVLGDVSSTRSLQTTAREVTSSPARKPSSGSSVDVAPTAANTNQSTVTTPTERTSDSQPSSDQSQSFVITVAPPDMNPGIPASPVSPNGNPLPTNGQHCQEPSSAGRLQSAPAHLTSSNSHLSPTSAMDSTSSMQRRKSYDDGVRPLNVLLAKNAANQDKELPTGGLSVPGQTSRADRRRSINPGLTLQFKDAIPNSAPPEMVRSQTLPIRSNSPVAPSPTKTYLDDFVVRRSSDASLLRDNASGSTIYHSPSPSPAIPENGRATPEPTRTRSASHDPQFHSIPRPTTPSRAPRPIVTLERPPKRSHSLRRPNGADGANGHSTNPPPGSMMPPPFDGSRSERSSPLGWNGDRMRPTSPSHRVDVPHGVESGTDTEAESSNGRGSDDIADTPLHSPPRPPPKPRPEPLKLNVIPDISAISQPDGSEESSPVERTSIATFIAPALPPIRFSMSGTDFSDFLKSVGGIPSLKSLNEIAQQEDALPRSPTSINTLVPQDDAVKSNVTGGPPGNSTRSSGSAAPLSSDDGAEDTGTVPHTSHEFPSRERTTSESQAPPSQDAPKREQLDSIVSPNIDSTSQSSTTCITVTSPADNLAPLPATSETHDLVVRLLQEALSDANARGSQQLRFEKTFVETILTSLAQPHKEYLELKEKYDGTKRASERYIDGLTVAQKEYDRELVARRNAESEIIRLRVLLSGQAAKLTALTGENSRREARQQLSEELVQNLDRLEKDLSKLKVERDVTLAEVEELCSSKSAPSNVSSGEVSVAQLSRSLTMRLDNIKKQYQHDLIPLTQQRETLLREIAELKSAREQFLEETTVLNARNEELAQLSAQYIRRMEVARVDVPPPLPIPLPLPVDIFPVKQEPVIREKKSTSFDRSRPTQELIPPVQPPPSMGSNPSTATLIDDREIKVIRVPKPDFSDPIPSAKHGIFKWPGYRVRDQTLAPKGKEHNFQPASAIRFTRCDHCGDKLWGGSHFRCTACHINVHSRCVNQAHPTCSQHPTRPREDINGIAQAPSIFGRDLAEQVKFDLRWGERKVPIVVEKCIEAVETLALDFEGIYRKTGGLSQTKMITQLFDRGDYTAFDLRDTDRFNDICSVTSVLKTYFRSLPVPLLTYDLHEEFIAAAGMKDSPTKTKQLQELVGRLPPDHYHTLRLLLFHLYRVREHSDMNLMSARNLGVVFGPTLMRSRDAGLGSEFSDMAGKALMIEWLVENAPTIFQS